MSSNNKLGLDILGIYDQHLPVNMFIEHIKCLEYVSIKGIVTLARLKEAFEEKWKDNEAKLAAAMDFYNLQIEDGAPEDAVVSGDNEDDVSVFHFNCFEYCDE